MKDKVYRRWIAIVGVLGISACAGRVQSASGDYQEPARLHFTNETLDQADVYAFGPGLARTRIGTVMAGRTETIVIPSAMLHQGEVSVFARLVASSATPETGPFALHSGDAFNIRLPMDARALVLLPAKE